MATGLGLDTGGTYTDAVVMDLDRGTIICKAKALTTREDLSIGIRNAISGFDQELLGSVGVVSLSSTLATNSVVEGKGCRVALVNIGGDYDNSVPVDVTVMVKGRHGLHGEETEPLDEECVKASLESLKGKVDAIAVNGYMAVRNPAHENRVKNLAEEILGIPAVCGHDLSSGLGFSERAATCIMNAMLISVIDELIRSVKAVLSERDIHAPLMIVRGDGAMMSESVARERPVETVLCGPAASLIGAMHLTGVRDAIVMDMGGTTTDIGILRDGRPRLEPEGAVIGGKRTRVLAAEIATSGIGGDSRILVNGNRILLSSVRAMPVCVAASQWPCVAKHMAELASKDTRPTPESLGEYNVVLDCEMFRTIRDPPASESLTEADSMLLDLAKERPCSLNDAGAMLNVHPFTFNISKLEGRGYLQRIGVTPTDILHAEGTYTGFDPGPSRDAVLYLSRRAGMGMDAFIDGSKKAIREKLCRALMEELISEETGSSELGKAGEDLLAKAIDGKPGRDFGCSIHIEKPIIGIGAPAGVYIRWVGEAFGTEVLIHEDADVGNAVGAVTSSVSESVEFLIRPESIGSDSCPFEVFSRMGNRTYPDLETAIADSEERGRRFVAGKVADGGAENITVSIDRKDRRFTYGSGGGEALMDVTLTVTAAGKPRQFGTRSGQTRLGGVMKMKISQIAGFLGSGKTSALMKIVDELVKRGHRIAIVVNDVGDISVDARFIEAHGLKAKEISGGCICCQIAGSFAETLAKLHDSFDPDIVIVEPSGVAIPWGLKRAAEYSESKTEVVITHAPVITLVDSTRIDMLMKAVKRLVETQIREADICFVNKVDAATADNIARTEEVIRSINPKARILRMSSVTGEGIMDACDAIESGTSARYDEAREAELLKKQYNAGGERDASPRRRS